MTPEELEQTRLESASALRVAIEAVPKADGVRSARSVLGPETEPASTTGTSPQVEAPPVSEWDPPTPPNLEAVNESWRTPPRRVKGSLLPLLGGRELDHEAQIRFNSDQVQLDNALVTWTAEHFAATHRHYDGVINRMQKRMDDIDTRHRELGRELVRHVHEMARRIDVVLGEGEKGRVSHESALRSVRERLRTLEEKIR